MREMTDGIEQYALISPSKVSLQSFGQTRWITVVRCPLDHESRRRNRFHFVELALQGIVPGIPSLPFAPTRTISVACHEGPIRVGEALCGLRKLDRGEPAGRTPCLPLDACELDRTCLDLGRSTIDAQEPLVPESPCLLKRWNRKEALRLIREGQSGDGRDTFWKQGCDRVGGSGACSGPRRRAAA